MQAKHLRSQQEESQRRTKEKQKRLSQVNTQIDQLSEEKDQASADRQELIKKKVAEIIDLVTKSQIIDN